MSTAVLRDDTAEYLTYDGLNLRDAAIFGQGAVTVALGSGPVGLDRPRLLISAGDESPLVEVLPGWRLARFADGLVTAHDPQAFAGNFEVTGDGTARTRARRVRAGQFDGSTAHAASIAAMIGRGAIAGPDGELLVSGGDTWSRVHAGFWAGADTATGEPVLITDRAMRGLYSLS